ncbi:serine/threonine-protein kinase [Sphingomonas zeicaulis]|uniref:serine/threonine-protein kinase n=1 Tax=Sphingomonas zeicaulis TaxID=1632740 RepID=UPI003D221608
MTGEDDEAPATELRPGTGSLPQGSLSGGSYPGAAGDGEARPITVGVVLNGIYRVERPVARGGMGQVFAGVNVETDERVAIKVVHRHLASDPRVQTMFRKEARILTQLSHPTIVQYRVLARDPAYDATYIVTDFIDGRPLSSLLVRKPASLADVVTLGRRMAQALAVANDSGAIHRDISPDNILIPDAGIGAAKIIDFGIAKSLAIGSETVIGDGFAGKIGYVAPEQFGNFGRDIGPWTDVYSVALVLLAYARGEAADMGNSLAEAVDRRRNVPSLAGIPDPLRPMLGGMLAPDPKRRTRSMHDVLKALDAIDVTGLAVSPPTTDWRRRLGFGARQPTIPPAATPAPPEKTLFAPVSPPPSPTAPPRLPVAPRKPARRWHRRAPLLAAPLALGLLAWGATRGDKGTPEPEASPVVAAPVQAAGSSHVALAYPDVACSWLSWSGGDGAAPALSGVAADPAAAASAAFAKAGAGALPGAPDGSGIQPLDPRQCAAVDGLRRFRAIEGDGPPPLLPEQPSFERSGDAPGCPAGSQARPVITLAPPDPSRDFALLAIQPTGQARVISRSRVELEALARSQPDRVGRLPDGRVRVTLCEPMLGANGVAMIEANGAPDLGATRGGGMLPGQAFLQALERTASAQQWSTRVAWFTVADTIADPARPVAPARVAKLPAARRAVVATPIPTATPEPAAKAEEGEACWRHDGKWRQLGRAPLSACVARVFAECSVQAGQSGEVALRRYDGRIEGKGGRYRRWRRLATDSCAKDAARDENGKREDRSRYH